VENRHGGASKATMQPTLACSWKGFYLKKIILWIETSTTQLQDVYNKKETEIGIHTICSIEWNWINLGKKTKGYEHQ
jgi:hypothetical protein